MHRQRGARAGVTYAKKGGRKCQRSPYQRKLSRESRYAGEILVPVCDRAVGCRSQLRVCLRVSEYLEAVGLEFILT
jgi:hypothetical protein